MFGIKINKTFVHFLYDNGIVETINIVRESDKELKCGDKTIVKITDHARIDDKGRRHYYVYGHDMQTSIPFMDRLDSKKKKEVQVLERETVHAVMRSNLLKSLVQSNTMPMMTVVLILLGGAGIGYVLGSEYGGGTINNIEDTDNYYQNADKENGTIVLSLMDLSLLNNINMEVFSWKTT